MAQWVDMKAEKITHWAHVGAWPPYLRLIRDYVFFRLHPESQKIMKETRDFYYLTPTCLPIEPLGELDTVNAIISTVFQCGSQSTSDVKD